MKRHHADRRGNMKHFEEKRLQDVQAFELKQGGLIFGYVQRVKAEGEPGYLWVSVNDLVFDAPVLFEESRHMGVHVDGERLGSPRSFMEPTGFEDGGALTILVDAYAANPDQREELLNMIVGLAVQP